MTQHEPTQETWQIARVDPADRRQAMARLMTTAGSLSDAQADRLDDYIRQMGVDVGNLWAAYDPAGRMGPVALIVPRRGRTAMVFFSTPDEARLFPPTVAVLDRAAAAVDGSAVSLLQALIDPDDDRESRVLTAAHFQRLACLHYLQRHVPGDAAMPAWPHHIDLQPYTPPSRSLFIEALDASYEQTRDCPALRGARSTEDVLDGHMATGQFDPDLWTLVMLDGRPVGALLLNPVPEHRCVELVYLGLAMRVRGQGLGKMLLQRALAQCAARRHRIVTLAVDADNTPAMAVYRGAGFFRVARKVALVRMLNAGSPDEAAR